MANNFAGDPNCTALWRFENGALTADSKGANTLTAVNTPTADQVNFKEGAASVQLTEADTDYLVINDVNLDAGFPLKNGDAVKKISATFWVRFDSLPVVVSRRACFNKDGLNKCSILIGLYNDMTDSSIELSISSNGMAWTSYLHASAIAINTWYHVGVTYQDSDQVYRIRIWDDTAGAILGVDLTGVGVNIFVTNGAVKVGDDQAGAKMDGKIDEMVIFNDILTVAQIDAIRAGTYNVGAPPIFGGLNKKRVPLAAAQKVGMLAEL